MVSRNITTVDSTRLCNITDTDLLPERKILTVDSGSSVKAWCRVIFKPVGIKHAEADQFHRVWHHLDHLDLIFLHVHLLISAVYACFVSYWY